MPTIILETFLPVILIEAHAHLCPVCRCRWDCFRDHGIRVLLMAVCVRCRA